MDNEYVALFSADYDVDPEPRLSTAVSFKSFPTLAAAVAYCKTNYTSLGIKYSEDIND